MIGLDRVGSDRLCFGWVGFRWVELELELSTSVASIGVAVASCSIQREFHIAIMLLWLGLVWLDWFGWIGLGWDGIFFYVG